MKMMKKVLAMSTAAAMVFGMSITAFADVRAEATITVTNAEDAELDYAQIIEPDQTTVTGWAFVNDTVEQAFLTAFNETDDQTLLDRMATAANNPDSIKTEYAAALNNIAANLAWEDMANPQTVTEAGVYAIKALEDGYTYGYMAAYVGFGEVVIDGITYEYPSLEDEVIGAKKSPTTTEKGDNDDDNLVQIGQVVTYTIEAYVPYFDETATNKTFSITDTISGADYYLTGGDDAVATVEIDGIDGTYKNADDFVVDGSSFTIDLSELVTGNNDNNRYAGNKVTVTYTAKVTGTTVQNTAASHVGDDVYNSDPVALYTAQIIMTKSNVEGETLSGAGFLVYKMDNDTKVYATFDNNSNFAGWAADKNGATEIFSGEDGTLTITGLDEGTYYFEEKTAPTGYSLNENDSSVTVEVNDNNSTEGVVTGTITFNTTMTDTKLSSLPSTGGIGTTIFTIGGCAIMIAAASLFFVSRRKSESK